MQYVRKQERVDAIQLITRTTLDMGEGEEKMVGEAGDWLVKTQDGEHIILTNEEFESKYEPAAKARALPHDHRVIAPDELFKLYEEKQGTSSAGGYLQTIPPQYNPAQYQQYPNIQQQQFSNLPPMIQSASPQQPPQQQPTHPPQKKKKSGLGGLFGGGKKKRVKGDGKDEFTSDNIQAV